MTKYVFVKSPVVHLLADTQAVPVSSTFARDMRRRGSDVPDGDEVAYFYDTLPSEVVCGADIKEPRVSDAEMLSVFSGKSCYNAFGKNGSKKTAKQYLSDSVYNSSPPHLSIAYHAHFSFYISGISRRIGEELKRHNIGTSVSQLSSRYCIHAPRFVVPPRYLKEQEQGYHEYKLACKSAYRHYLLAVNEAENLKGLEKKRRLEAAAGLLPMSVETTLVMTFNPISARKMIWERTGETADLEFNRLAEKIRTVLEIRYAAFNFR